MGEVVTLPGIPQPKQEEFFLADSRHIGYGGARGGGKSWALRRKMVLRRLMYPGSKGLLLRRTYPELLANHVLPLQTELGCRKKKGWLARYNAQEHVFRFVNGSMLFLGYCKAEADVLRYQGQEYDDIGLEEATHFTEFQVNFLRTCLRTVRTDLQPRIYYTANPGGVGHLWFKRLFIDKQYEEDENPADYTFIPARVWDNQVLMNADPGYIKELQKLPEDLRRAYLDGDWDVFAGQYFKSFRRDVHVITPRELPKWHKRFRSLDYGLDRTACYWWAVDSEGNCIVYRELYESGLTLSQAAKKIVEMTPAEERMDYTVGSPDLWNKRQETGQSGAEIMYDAGLTDLVCADHNRIPGWRVLTEYLEPFQDPNTGATTARLLIFANCVNLIRTLPSLVHDDHNPEDVSDKGEDHAAESVRYGVMSRPRKAKEPESAKTVIQQDKQALADKARLARRRLRLRSA
ncbi:MAG TPA: hypothetical protein GX716_01255 [Firmicutes bacterium]|nr:hypothetical protein [Candidatus Fermentithermobacillaceae bacterium]